MTAHVVAHDGTRHPFGQGSDIVTNCVDPDAPIGRCVQCGAPVHTCERVRPEGNSYLCPAHPRGHQLHGGAWVCSEHCADEATGDGA